VASSYVHRNEPWGFHKWGISWLVSQELCCVGFVSYLTRYLLFILFHLSSHIVDFDGICINSSHKNFMCTDGIPVSLLAIPVDFFNFFYNLCVLNCFGQK
jgi:hypothetical protein